MANYYRNPTASAAIGTVDKEISRIRKRAKYLCACREQGRLSQDALEAVKKQYSGFYRKVLENALREF